MIRINDVHAIKLIASHTFIDLEAKIYCIAQYDTNDKFTGGVILMGDNGHSMEIHSYVPKWGTRELLWATFNFVFKVRRVKKLFGRVPEDNYKARKLNRHIGFTEEAIISDVYRGGVGLVIMSMYEEDCRFVNTKPPKVTFAPLEKTSIVEVKEYSLPTPYKPTMDS